MSLFSFEETALIQRLKHKNFEPTPLDDWWDFDDYGDYDNYEPEYVEQTDKVGNICFEWDRRINRARVAQRKRRGRGF